MNPDRSHRHALVGCGSDDRNRTIILWRETVLVHCGVVRKVVITLDATMSSAVILTSPEAVELADAVRAAAG